jgi:TIR domain
MHMAHDVFISHSTQDKTVADAVCAALEDAGIRCWIAPRDVQPGRSFAGEIARAIKKSKAMVLIFSAHSNNSEQVLREVQLAVTAHLHIVQFRIGNVILNDDLSYFLGTPHWLDALTPPLENHIDRLETALRALLGAPVEPLVMAAPATQPPRAIHPRRLWRSMAAVLVGFLVYVVLSFVTALTLQQIRNLPRISGFWVALLSLFCTWVFSIAAGYFAARLAPGNPMRHVWVLGCIVLITTLTRFVGVAPINVLASRAAYVGFLLSVLLCVWLGGVLHRRCVKQRRITRY